MLIGTNNCAKKTIESSSPPPTDTPNSKVGANETIQMSTRRKVWNCCGKYLLECISQYFCTFSFLHKKTVIKKIFSDISCKRKERYAAERDTQRCFKFVLALKNIDFATECYECKGYRITTAISAAIILMNVFQGFKTQVYVIPAQKPSR